MKSTHYDLAVLGAGCFATQLANQLRRMGWRGRMVLLDRRACFDQVQRWCWWRKPGAPSDEAGITREWSAYVFRTDGDRWHERQLRQWRYAHVDSRKFFAAAHRDWVGDQRIELRTGVSVESVQRTAANNWRIQTSDGALTAALVVDSRSLTRRMPQQAFAPGQGWWQSFEGRVMTGRIAPLTDDQFCLMDLDSGAKGALGFGYILSLESGLSLVEYTQFDRTAVARASLGRDLDRYLESLAVEDVARRTVEREGGWLPMTTDKVGQTRHCNGVLAAGLCGGAARPASGYAFARITRQAFVLADAIARGNNPQRALARDRPRWINRFDGIFLRTLGTRPELARPCFSRLLQGLSGDQMASFMAERPGPRTMARVLRVLPKIPFLLGALRQMRAARLEQVKVPESQPVEVLT